ncbi:uncharacterized protein LOC143039929 [Oratosquilla oratoria]|uniref:uncharacterized protein LOC143039929 n=1 Tax=Oratosquilla oratoria TaxID=337810 RepID=UPI003F77714A
MNESDYEVVLDESDADIFAKEIDDNITLLFRNAADDSDDYGDEEISDGNDDLLITQITTTILVFLVTYGLALLPIYLLWKQKKKGESLGKDGGGGGGGNKWASYASDIGGGALLALCILHLIPEVHDIFLGTVYGTYYFGELLVILSFLFIYILDAFLHYLYDPGSSHGHSHMPPTPPTPAKLRTPPNRPSSRPTSRPSSIYRETDMDNWETYETVTLTVDANLSTHSLNETKLSTSQNHVYTSVPQLPTEGKKLEDEDEDEEKGEETEEEVHKEESINVGTMIFCAVISLHSLMEGTAIGVQDNISTFVTLTLAIMAHKTIISFYLGFKMITTYSKRWMAVFLLFIFSVATPVGMSIGIAVGITANRADSSGGVMNGVFVGLSAGAMLHVCITEGLAREDHDHGMEHTNENVKSGRPNFMDTTLGQRLRITIGAIAVVLINVLAPEH